MNPSKRFLANKANMDEDQFEQGPTGAILRDLPSPYEAHPCGLLHLPRFLAKIRKHLAGELPKSYQRNFTKGFDGFLCLHLGVDPQEIIRAVRDSANEAEVELRLAEDGRRLEAKVCDLQADQPFHGAVPLEQGRWREGFRGMAAGLHDPAAAAAMATSLAVRMEWAGAFYCGALIRSSVGGVE